VAGKQAGHARSNCLEIFIISFVSSYTHMHTWHHHQFINASFHQSVHPSINNNNNNNHHHHQFKLSAQQQTVHMIPRSTSDEH